MEGTEDYAGQYPFGGQHMDVMERYKKNNQESCFQRIGGDGAMQTYTASNQQNRKSISYMGKGLIRSWITQAPDFRCKTFLFIFLEKAVEIGGEEVRRNGRQKWAAEVF